MRLGGYPKIYSISHAALHDLLLDPVIVEEKVDGSQISFGVLESGACGEPQLPRLLIRSKEAEIHIGEPNKMFQDGVNAIITVADQLTPGWVYRGEYLMKPKHNALAYDRIPANHIMLFDINDGLESYLSPEAKAVEAARLGFEAVPVLLQGALTSYDEFAALLERTSVLGGQKIEGIVVKNYARFGRDGKALMGKFVSEHFKEVHGGEWRKANPIGRDIITEIVASIRTPARWEKAVQHLRERGQLQGAPQDIGPLMREVSQDVLAECKEEISERLFKWAWKEIGRKVCGGLPEYYKERLARQQFEPKEAA